MTRCVTKGTMLLNPVAWWTEGQMGQMGHVRTPYFWTSSAAIFLDNGFRNGSQVFPEMA